jgi:glycosyltransferase involved in cell wall biosynthesis
MKKDIYIIDLIGTHSGMHYYHSSFLDLFKNEQTINFNVLSNYTETDEKSFFYNIFIHNTIVNICRMLIGWVKLFFFILFHKKSHFIYLSYGSLFDIPFLFLSILNRKRFIVDIHEIYDLASPPSNIIRKTFDFVYKYLIKITITHSEKTNQRLSEIGFNGTNVLVPHFKYTNYHASFTGETIKKEVRQLFKSDKINILFFGHIRLSKGIDLLYELINKIENVELKEKINIIIAGNDTDNIIEKKKLTFNNDISYTMLLRRISDNELEYIFNNCNYLILPYKEISQSGIVEMAIKYRKPMLLSDIPEFNHYLEKFSSFGHIISLTNKKQFENLLQEITFTPLQHYIELDLIKYNKNELFEKFITNFKKII